VCEWVSMILCHVFRYNLHWYGDIFDNIDVLFLNPGWMVCHAADPFDFWVLMFELSSVFSVSPCYSRDTIHSPVPISLLIPSLQKLFLLISLPVHRNRHTAWTLDWEIMELAEPLHGRILQSLFYHIFPSTWYLDFVPASSWRKQPAVSTYQLSDAKLDKVPELLGDSLMPD
jgi:hypothetical protein